MESRKEESKGGMEVNNVKSRRGEKKRGRRRDRMER